MVIAMEDGSKNPRVATAMPLDYRANGGSISLQGKRGFHGFSPTLKPYLIIL
jgi:hypothetical protein